MGTWGTGLFEDDLTADAAGMFERYLQEGVDSSDAADKILREFGDVLDDPDEGPVLYLSLASLLADNGIREHSVVERAKSILQNQEGLGLWREAGDEELRARLEVYRTLEGRLSSPTLNKVKTAPRKGGRKKPIVGDIIEIPLPDGRFGYGYYIGHVAKYGGLLSVFNRVELHPVPCNELIGTPPMFPPVFAPHIDEVRSGRWRVCGHVPIEHFELPLFRSGNWLDDFKVSYWYLWDGNKDIEVGPDLPDKYRNLELLIFWGGKSIEDRIANGGRLEWLDKIH